MLVRVGIANRLLPSKSGRSALLCIGSYCSAGCAAQGRHGTYLRRCPSASTSLAPARGQVSNFRYSLANQVIGPAVRWDLTQARGRILPWNYDPIGSSPDPKIRLCALGPDFAYGARNALPATLPLPNPRSSLGGARQIAAGPFQVLTSDQFNRILKIPPFGGFSLTRRVGR